MRLRLSSQPVSGFRLPMFAQRTHQFPGPVWPWERRAWVPDVRCLRTMIGGLPVVAAPAGLDVITAGHPTVVVDMNRTRFCDASGLHTLLRVHKRALSEGGELRLVIPAGGAVSHVIYLTCLDRLILCFSGGSVRARRSAPLRGRT